MIRVRPNPSGQMISRRATLLTVLGRSRQVAGLALVAAYLQLFVVVGALVMEAAHLTGAPAGVLGPMALYLCHSGDDDNAAGDQGEPVKSLSHCLLVQTAQAAGHGMPPVALFDLAPLDPPTLREFASASYWKPSAARLRYGSSRGPPLLVRV